jgi:hypothetical protein
VISALAAAVAMLAQGAPHQVGQGLDCSLGFEGLVAEVESRAGVERQPNPPTVPYITYADASAKTLYTFTTEGAVGHPGVVRRDVVSKGDGVYVNTSACGFGTRGVFHRMLTQFRDLNGKARTELQSRASR